MILILSVLTDATFRGTNVENILFKPERCSICRSSGYNEWLLGQKYKFDDLVVHHFCLFAGRLVKTGGKEGILGFRKDEILKEIENSEQIRCAFCNQMGAASKCCEPKCEIVFHYSCGMENGIFSRFNNDHQ